MSGRVPGGKARPELMKDVVGHRFGLLTVVARRESKTRLDGPIQWMCVCQCDCGGSKTTSLSALRNGLTKSCGCRKKQSAGRLYTFRKTYAGEPTNA